MRALLLALPFLMLAGAADAVDPPPAFLDQIEGRQALDWVHAQNKRSLAVLQGDPRYAGLRAKALALAEAKDRIAMPEFVGQAVYNFWQDPSHVRGIWRKTDFDSYRTGKPVWTTVLDLDALAARDHANWVWKGADCEAPAYRRCLISLSDGGEDATTVREFDLTTDKFVPGGFLLPHSKQAVDWADDDHVLVARDWGPGTMTVSGYPFVLKRLARGATLGQAVEVFRGTANDVSVGGGRSVDGDGNTVTVVTRGLDAFNSKFLIFQGDRLVPIDVPERATLVGFVANRLVFEIDSDWQPTAGPKVAKGSLVSLPAGRLDGAPQVVFAPGPRQMFEEVGSLKHGLAVTIFDNVRGQGWVYTPAGDGWSGKRMPLPDDVSVGVVASNEQRDQVVFDVTGFLTPTQLWLADAAKGTASMIRSLPAKFDASKLVVEQDEATSSDGTKIPYFVVHAKDMKLDGHNPTELYAYGGFQISMTPKYDAALGALWLTHGGVYALANIRGGGEFGPAWHDAAVKTHRQLAFDDFAAVGRDLVTRKITDTAHLGIRGGSNGGLLMGVEFTQHPELWHAVVIEVPLLDMLNFETMSAGASWTGEYGSVANPDERSFLARISPLANLRAGVDYPEPFIFTTTKDDRVGPVHARRFAWRMAELKLPFLYYEETEGGHAAGANLPEVATERALEYTYLTRMLMGTGAH
jgi:prolyl oligopeptidase